ncbi:copper resistance protein CopC [Micromonospora sp. HM134]|uniref:copper resistance CopC family protein n=1 Tax=unclassified Micromonospora TaxID=2617518 RepID=UPI001198CADB|nr:MULTISPECIES: copper resistance CopC family protein [unclassified Micromonospora]QDY09990.1 copper resistance protein CopC [Micromonospora sp. HM134]
MGGRVPRLVRAVPVLVGVALGVALLPASPAFAHNSLTGSNPANGAKVATAPAAVELRFLAKLDPDRTKITVTGPDNIPAAGGEPTFSGSRVRVPFAPGAAGLYIVDYQLPSSDGHPVKGEVRFTLTTGTAAAPPSPSVTPSANPTPSPSPSSAAPDSPSATPVAATGTDDAGRGWLWAAAGGLVLLAALAGGLFLRRRRSTRT